MAGNFNNVRTSFASGEVNPSIRAANDLARFQTGAAIVENMLVMIEAILTRRPGTRFVLELKDQSQRGKMVPYRFSGSDYYVLGINGGTMRVLKDQGFLESSPGHLFELAVPWIEADIDNLRSVGSGNTVIQVAAGKRPQKLTRNGHTDWAIAEYQPKNGPVEAQNLDTNKTIQASAIIGTGVTLTGAGSPFSGGQVDGVFKLIEPSQSIVPLWQADEVISLSALSPPAVTSNFGDVTTPANAFGITGANKAAATAAYAGETYAGVSNVLSADIQLTSPAPGDTGTVTLQLYAKPGGVPANGTDGTLLQQLTIDVDTEGGALHSLISTDVNTGFGQAWLRATYSGGATNITLINCAIHRASISATPLLRRWQENVYQAITAGNAGLNAPVHTEGDVAAGTGSVIWRYLHSGYGFVRIVAVGDPNHAICDVLTRLPDSVKAQATYRWAAPSWCDDLGWPKQVSTFDQRMQFQRDNVYWLTKPLTVDDFELTTFEDSAIARRLLAPDGSFVQLEWAVASGILVQGSRDFEWITRPPTDNGGLTALNVRDIPDQAEGSAPQIPAILEKGVIFIGKSRQRLHYARFARLAQELAVQEISIASRHIFAVGAAQVVWQRDPHRIAWVRLMDGTLAACTFMPDEKIVGFTRCPMPGCFVEDIVAIPTADNGRSDVYLQTRRTINGQTKRYYELLMPFFAPADPKAPTAAGAWFVDCGLHYAGAPVASVTGLSHLEGETVAVFADGAEQTRKVVTGGAITLDAAASDVVVGLPIAWKFRDLPRDVTVQGQSSHGDPQRASHIVIDVQNAAGGTVSFNSDHADDLTETGSNDYGASIPLLTGKIKQSIGSNTADEGAVELAGDNALPFTLLGITPLLEIEDPT